MLGEWGRNRKWEFNEIFVVRRELNFFALQIELRPFREAIFSIPADIIRDGTINSNFQIEQKRNWYFQNLTKFVFFSYETSDSNRIFLDAFKSTSVVSKNWYYYSNRNFNPHTPDRFTPLHARCAENCGSALTNR